MTDQGKEGEPVLLCVHSTGDGSFDVAGSRSSISGVKGQGASQTMTTTTTGAMPGASLLSLKKMNAVLGGMAGTRIRGGDGRRKQIRQERARVRDGYEWDQWGGDA